VGALLGLVFGCGLLLIWRSGARAPRRRAATTRRWIVSCTDLLRQAGVDGVGPAQLLGVQLLCAVVVGAIVLGMTSTLAVATCFAAFGFIGPVMPSGSDMPARTAEARLSTASGPIFRVS
jgi:tight adherence protein B